MTARLRIIVAALACLLAAMPALAQDAAQQVPPPAPPPQGAIVGPPQLSNFSLNGTVTRAAPAPAPVPKKSAAAPPKTTSSTPPPTRTGPAPGTSEASRATAPKPARTAPEPQSEVAASKSSTAPLTDAPAPIPESLPAVPAASPAAPAQRLPILPWIIAALAVAGAAVWFFFFRNRNRESYAGMSGFDLAPEAPPRPAPPPPVQPRVPPEPKASPPAAAPVGVVSTRLRPWLDIEFQPDRAVVDDNRAAVAFEISVLNSGTVVARDVLLEASLFNAGPVQDQQIQLFFDNPVGKGDRIPAIPPMKRIKVETAVFMARDQVRPIEIEGRPLFVPMIAFNALYRWGGSEGQTSASFLVGKGSKGEKLTPFRLDLGPRIFRGLDAREHELKVRK
jgi:hypothetical protein